MKNNEYVFCSAQQMTSLKNGFQLYLETNLSNTLTVGNVLSDANPVFDDPARFSLPMDHVKKLRATMVRILKTGHPAMVVLDQILGVEKKKSKPKRKKGWQVTEDGRTIYVG